MRFFKSFQVSFAVIWCLLVLLMACSSFKSPTDTGDDVTISSTVSIKGKVLDSENNPIEGAVASLTVSGLSAITNANGEYHIQGTGVRKCLAKASDEVVDTLVVTNEGDEIQKEPISGLVLEMPETYIEQREIRCDVFEGSAIASVVAVLWDDAVPDIKKTVGLWYDAANSQCHRFAYFYYDTTKNYTLYVKTFDSEGRFIGRSADYNFSGKAGNIKLPKSFVATNAKPQIQTMVDGSKSYSEDVFNIGAVAQVTVQVTAIDSFGGQIAACSTKVGASSYVGVASSSLARRSSEVGSFTGTASLDVPTGEDTVDLYVQAVDSDGNSTIEKYSLVVCDTVITVTLEVVGSGDTTIGSTTSPYWQIRRTYTVAECYYLYCDFEWHFPDMADGLYWNEIEWDKGSIYDNPDTTITYVGETSEVGSQLCLRVVGHGFRPDLDSVMCVTLE